MQHAKQESAQESTDDSDDQLIDDSLASPLYDHACEPAGHQIDQQEPNNIHYHTSSLPVCGGVLAFVFWAQDRIAALRQMFGNCEENARLVILKVAEQAARRECAGRNPRRRQRQARPH